LSRLTYLSYRLGALTAHFLAQSSAVSLSTQ
jgi:hypothetical protein